jgi:23S rRNA (uracil1939-C5)-methyltransferase
MANFYKVKAESSSNSHKKQKLTVKVEKLDLNGCGVAYYKNKPVFINGALPNEVIEIKLVEQKNKFSIAKLLTIIKASENRVTAQCPHFALCGGCDLQHLEYSQQLSFKKNKIIELFSRAEIDGRAIDNLPWHEPISTSQWRYRRKARIGVQFDKNSQATIGFRQKSTNQLVAIKSCPVLVEPAVAIFPVLKELINQLSVKKSVGHVEIICTEFTDEFAETQLKVTLIVRQIRTINEHDSKLWNEYAKKYQWQLFFQESDSKKTLSPEGNLSYKLDDDIEINFTSTDFIQINQQVNFAMVAQALVWLTPNKDDHVLDLFCGLGNFSLPLARKVSHVTGVEGVQTMVDRAKNNAAYNDIGNCSFYQADLNSGWLDSTWIKKKFSKVLIDPARAGADLAIKQLVKLNIPVVLYVSCEPTTLARDSKILLSNGYHIKKIGLIDMFSQTKHVETMVLFSK